MALKNVGLTDVGHHTVHLSHFFTTSKPTFLIIESFLTRNKQVKREMTGKWQKWTPSPFFALMDPSLV